MASIIKNADPIDQEESNDQGSILWPRNGGLIRIWSIISRKNDGFLQVKQKLSNGNFLLDGKGIYDNRSKFRMYTKPAPVTYSAPSSDETPCWIGIPGEHIGSKADKNLIYMLKWTDDQGHKIVVAKGYPLPAESSESPEVPSADQIYLTFLLKFDNDKACFILRDYDMWMSEPRHKFFYVKTNGNGNITREKLERDEITQAESQGRYYNDPGLMYYIDNYGI